MKINRNMIFAILVTTSTPFVIESNLSLVLAHYMLVIQIGVNKLWTFVIRSALVIEKLVENLKLE